MDLMPPPVADLDWAEGQFAGPRCELRDSMPDRSSLPCELPATCRMVITHDHDPGHPDDTTEQLSCGPHRELVESLLGLDGLIGACPHCGGPIRLARVEPL